ncbi:hypothetical protein EIN_325970 [Entamoeba invadens IP1]|uniref:Uncharacterized protein n=1 Tax=Entamoeba invadens IP1 TaxID=370355 RepID=L7FLR0_ENTIV|nr:hypothetical protein EIN_325970 [Entamoeba invadens IP1]ELP87546.1 hypothetical protein EIN_325970 [Entamoeba invadens IP1]|eukprot:XP_004254317.1 hypothetical protein EIN_325970 [Entamoeba invadens IP1]
MAWYITDHDDHLEAGVKVEDFYDIGNRTFKISRINVLFIVYWKKIHGIPKINSGTFRGIAYKVDLFEEIKDIEEILINRAIYMSNFVSGTGALGFVANFFTEERIRTNVLIDRASKEKTLKKARELVQMNIGPVKCVEMMGIVESLMPKRGPFPEYDRIRKASKMSLKNCEFVNVFKQWIRESYGQVRERGNNLILIGDSQIGKSVMLKYLKLPELSRNFEEVVDMQKADANFTYYRRESKYLLRVFDDLTLGSMKAEAVKNLMGCDSFELRVLRDTKTIYPCPLVLIFNPNAFKNFVYDFGDLAWLEKNCMVYPQVDFEKLRNPSTYDVPSYKELLYENVNGNELMDEDYLFTSALGCTSEELEQSMQSNPGFPCYYNVQKCFSERKKQVVTQVPIPIRPVQQMEEVHQSNEMEVEVPPQEDMGFIQTGYSQQYI